MRPSPISQLIKIKLSKVFGIFRCDTNKNSKIKILKKLVQLEVKYIKQKSY